MKKLKDLLKVSQQPNQPQKSIKKSSRTGAPPKAYPFCSQETKTKKIQVLNQEVNSLLSNRHPDLVRDWKEQFFDPPISKQDRDIQERNQIILTNIFKSFSSLPYRSKIRSSYIHEFFRDVPTTYAGEQLGITRQAVSKAMNLKDVRPLVYYLRNLGFTRQRSKGENHVLRWIDAFCLVPSGRSKRYFFGTVVGMYLSYHNWCLTSEFPTVHFSSFKRIKDREHIGLMKGDKFIKRSEYSVGEAEKASCYSTKQFRRSSTKISSHRPS